MEFPRQLTWKSSIARRSGSKATQIQAGIPHVHNGLIDEYATHFPRVGADPKIGPSPCAHLHIGAWLPLTGPRDLAVRLSEEPEK
jgi:hypothetical protein